MNALLDEKTDEVVPIHKAKSTLSQLVKRAMAGETIYIGGYGKPQVVLRAAETEEERAVADAELRKQAWGCLKGVIDEETMEKLTTPLPQEIIDSFYSMQGLEDFAVK